MWRFYMAERRYRLSTGYVEQRITEHNIKPFSKEQFINLLVSRNYSPQLVKAFIEVDRSFFMPEGVPPEYHYSLSPWPLMRRDSSTTISSPNVVADMTSKLGPIKEGDRILEVGTATGYQVAILRHMLDQTSDNASGSVTTIDINKKLVHAASRNSSRAGIGGITFEVGDGSGGYEKGGPYDKIIVTASVPPTPPSESPLIDQLDIGGTLVFPMGGFGRPSHCHMLKVKLAGPTTIETDIDEKDYRFVPMQGEYGWDKYIQMSLLRRAIEVVRMFGVSVVNPEEYLEARKVL